MNTMWPRVLVVDDEYNNYFLFQEILAPFMIDLSYARNGKDAVQHCSNNSGISMILMDYKMEGMNGFETALKIKSNHPNLPIVLQTAYANDFRDDVSMLQMFDGFLEKPIKKSKLFTEMSKYIKLQPLEESINLLRPAAVRTFLRCFF